MIKQLSTLLDTQSAQAYVELLLQWLIGSLHKNNTTNTILPVANHLHKNYPIGETKLWRVVRVPKFDAEVGANLDMALVRKGTWFSSWSNSYKACLDILNTNFLDDLDGYITIIAESVVPSDQIMFNFKSLKLFIDGVYAVSPPSATKLALYKRLIQKYKEKEFVVYNKRGVFACRIKFIR